MKAKNKSIITIGKRIRQLRKKKGWTQAKLAERIDKTTEMVCHLENGIASTKLKTLEAIAKVLDTDLTFLLRPETEFDTVRLSGPRLDLFREMENESDETVELLTRLVQNLKSKS